MIMHTGVGTSPSSQWDFWGSTLVTSQYVRLTPDDRSKQGSIWNTVVSKTASRIFQQLINCKTNFAKLTKLCIWSVRSRAIWRIGRCTCSLKYMDRERRIFTEMVLLYGIPKRDYILVRLAYSKGEINTVGPEKAIVCVNPIKHIYIPVLVIYKCYNAVYMCVLHVQVCVPSASDVVCCFCL